MIVFVQSCNKPSLSSLIYAILFFCLIIIISCKLRRSAPSQPWRALLDPIANSVVRFLFRNYASKVKQGNQRDPRSIIKDQTWRLACGRLLQKDWQSVCRLICKGQSQPEGDGTALRQWIEKLDCVRKGAINRILFQGRTAKVGSFQQNLGKSGISQQIRQISLPPKYSHERYQRIERRGRKNHILATPINQRLYLTLKKEQQIAETSCSPEGYLCQAKSDKRKQILGWNNPQIVRIIPLWQEKTIKGIPLIIQK